MLEGTHFDEFAITGPRGVVLATTRESLVGTDATRQDRHLLAWNATDATQVRPVLRTQDGRAQMVVSAPIHHGAQPITAVNAVVGTPAFIAPEVAMDSQSANARSDLYSLGVTAYLLLVGRLPSSHAEPVRMMVAHMTDAPAPLSIIDPAILDSHPADQLDGVGREARRAGPLRSRPTLPDEAKALLEH
ncbi:MAG: hypothetical protein JW751_03180 [Polyangiaceae bacterium]|nr:hypothetical protein [Polyangiaceae bacterium]